MTENQKVHVRIENDGIITEVFVNGQKIEGVKRVNFLHEAGWNRNLPKLEIELRADEVTLVSTRIPALPELYKPYYVSEEELINSGILKEKDLDVLQSIRR